MAAQLGAHEIRARQYGCGQTNSGPCGRRKTKMFNKMRRELADAAKKYSVVLACNDQARSQGTGVIGKAAGTLGRDWRKKALDALVEHSKAPKVELERAA